MMRLFTILALFIISIPAHAQWYKVELLVFEQLETVTDEQWPRTQGSGSTQYLSPPAASVSSLVGSAKRLNSSSKYRVHYHKAWQQSISRKASAKPVKIRSDNGMIEGEVRLYKSTYLFTNINLWLLQNKASNTSWSDVSPDGESISAPRNPNLKETRKIKSKQIDFFDHPKLGALLRITPI